MKITLLTKEQTLGDDALDVIKSYGTKTAVTDLSIILGAQTGIDNTTTIEGDCAGCTWLASDFQKDRVLGVNWLGKESKASPENISVAARPVLPASETSNICPNATRKLLLTNGKLVQICEFGEYPQDVAPEQIFNTLESDYAHGKSNFTGKSYTLGTEFQTVKYLECELDGKKYVRVIGEPFYSGAILSNGKTVGKRGKVYWLEVKPIEWLKDPSGVWVAKKALFAGIPFNRKPFYGGNFEQTDMNKYLETYFSKEMQTTCSNNQVHQANKSENTEEAQQINKRRRRYGIEVEEAPMTVKEQINFYVQNRMSFMLHGPSGVGKTARVEAIDPDLTAVPLWNGVLPEDIVGKVRYPNGETKLPDEDKEGGVWVAPDWYNELCKKCENEPDKKHVLFIDEVTNARPTTQSLIFHIALKKSISPSKGKLPDNAMVVLAGNNKEESAAAYNMPEPLFRRMCGHIYLEPDVPDWLEWGSEKSRKHPEDPERLNIHPIVSSFVGTYGKDVFYSAYDEENPKQWAMDPRGWEQVSDIIYDNKGVIRRELLESKMGKELAAHFLIYAKNPPLSLEEIISKDYNSYDIPQGNDAKLALTYSLRYVDEKNVGTVRDFIGCHLGAENRAVFDSLWIGKSDERALQIAQMSNYLSKGGR